MASNGTFRVLVLLGLTSVGLLPFVGCSSGSAVDPTTLVGTTPVAGVAAFTCEGNPVDICFAADAAYAGLVLEFRIVTPPANGFLSDIRLVDPLTAEVTYTPAPGFSGNDAFAFSYSAGGAQGEPTSASVGIRVYPAVAFSLDAYEGTAPLTVVARAFTLSGAALPEGNYHWDFGGTVEEGPVATHGERRHTFAAAGVYGVSLSLTLAGLSVPVGCSPATVRVEAANQTNPPPASQGSVLTLSPADGLTSSGPAGGPFSPPNKGYTLKNTGDLPLHWTASATQPWLAVPLAIAPLSAGGEISVTVSLRTTAADLPPGTYSDTVTFTNTDNAETQTRSVSLTVAAPSPAALSVTPSGGLTSSGNVGGPFSPSQQAYTLENTGVQSLNWTASKTQNWVSLSSTSGTLAASGSTTVTVSINANANNLALGSYSDTVTFTNATNGSGNTTRGVSLTVSAGNCSTSSASWQNAAFALQTGSFTAEFDAIPSNPVLGADGVTALSAAPGSQYSDYAVLVRFNESGGIDARNGGTYSADVPVSYTGGTSYHFRLVVNVPAHTYSAYVTLQGGSEQTLAVNYAFRTEQGAVANLANWGLISATGWTHQVCNFAVTANGAPLAANAGADKTISTGGSTTLDGVASGGTPPYSYAWTPPTGLTDPNIAQPTASPASTTTYTLTVTDDLGATATDAATVTVAAGNVYYVATNDPNANDTNPGTEALPWQTLAEAASVATAGDTVIVEAGTYSETLAPAHSGTAGAPITFRSQTPRAAIIDGGSARTSGVNLSGRTYIRVEGFEIRHNTDTAIYVQDYYGTAAQGYEILNNYIHHIGDYTTWEGGGMGVECRNVRDCVIAGNEFTYCGDTAINMGGQANRTDNLTIRENVMHHNGRDAVHGSGSHLLIEFNVCYDNFHTGLHQDAFDITTANGMVVRYNSLSDFTQLVYGSLVNGSDGFWNNVQIYGNVMYNDRYWTVGGLGGPGGTCPAMYISMGYASNYATNIEIFDNTIGYLGDTQKAIQVYGVSGSIIDNIRIYNNIFYECRGDVSGVAMDWSASATNVVSDYNCFYFVTPRSGQDTHSLLNTNPLFVNYVRHSAFNFRLQASSPCRQGGHPTLGTVVTLPSPWVDLDHVQRSPTNSTQGAYE